MKIIESSWSFIPNMTKISSAEKIKRGQNMVWWIGICKVILLVPVWTRRQLKNVLWSKKKTSSRKILIFESETRIGENFYQDCKENCSFLNLLSQKYNKYLNAKSSFWDKKKTENTLQIPTYAPPSFVLD
jgi:hypothetical protein